MGVVLRPGKVSVFTLSPWALVYPQVSELGIQGNGYLFDNLDMRHQGRFRSLVSEHLHSVNRAVNGLSALSGTAQPMAATKAMYRFLANEATILPALIEPAQEAVRDALARSATPIALAVHDWCMFSFRTHTAKKDLFQRTHAQDLGYDLGSCLIVDANSGRPLGPMELRLRTADGVLTTRPGEVLEPVAHIDELLGTMNDSRRWNLGKPLVHIVDREADSVGHYRAWDRAGHQFLVRAKDDRVVRWKGEAISLKALQKRLEPEFADPPDGPASVTKTKFGPAKVQVLEVEIVLDRPAKTRTAEGRVETPGTPLTLRLILTQVVTSDGEVRARWLLLTNVGAEYKAAEVARWYAWRWRIESYHKLLKTAGMNAEEWQQECGEAFAKRLVIASMACLLIWHLQEDGSEEAERLKKILQRLSGRQKKHKGPATAPALLAGLERLLAVLNLLETEKMEDIVDLVRKVLPRLVNSS